MSKAGRWMWVGLLLLTVGLTGCTRRLGDFTLLSTKNMNLADFSTGQAEKGARVKGSDAAAVVFIIPVDPDANIEEATDRAMEEAGLGCFALTNAVIRQEMFFLPYIYMRTAFVVEGNPVKHGS